MYGNKYKAFYTVGRTLNVIIYGVGWQKAEGTKQKLFFLLLKFF